MAKKKDTASLLEASVFDGLDAGEKLGTIKTSRSSNTGNGDTRTVSSKTEVGKNVVREKKNSFDKKEGTVPKKEKLKGEILLAGFATLMNQELYRDKKDQFLFRLSEEVTDGYEELARAYTYRTGHKVNRNDIIRKILEDFHKKNSGELLNYLNSM